jgi:hypothetical protein
MTMRFAAKSGARQEERCVRERGRESKLLHHPILLYSLSAINIQAPATTTHSHSHSRLFHVFGYHSAL